MDVVDSSMPQQQTCQKSLKSVVSVQSVVFDLVVLNKPSRCVDTNG